MCRTDGAVALGVGHGGVLEVDVVGNDTEELLRGADVLHTAGSEAYVFRLGQCHYLCVCRDAGT